MCRKKPSVTGLNPDNSHSATSWLKAPNKPQFPHLKSGVELDSHLCAHTVHICVCMFVCVCLFPLVLMDFSSCRGHARLLPE